MIGFAPAKINLGLRILSKRPDGYHDIESCFYPVPLYDMVEVIRQEVATEFTQSGIEVPGASEQNLCLKAYELLCGVHALLPVRMHLHKTIPVGAGLGGGSSDASRCLLLLNELFGLRLSEQSLREYALKLGSDCPFFIKNMPCIAEGRGEILTELPLLSLKRKRLVLVYPNIHVSTAEVYREIVPRRSGIPLKDILSKDIHRWPELLSNDFEEVVFKKIPQLSEVKNYFYKAGALYASMSGTGSVVFGIFNAETAVDLTFPSDYFVWNKVL